MNVEMLADSLAESLCVLTSQMTRPILSTRCTLIPIMVLAKLATLVLFANLFGRAHDEALDDQRFLRDWLRRHQSIKALSDCSD